MSQLTALKHLRWAILGIILSVLGTGPHIVDAAPLRGQIVVDPDNRAWLKYHQGGPLFMCGPGDPEGFLYRGTRNPDGTRTGDQMSLINKLKDTGANSIYLMAVRSHGGDGNSTENPFVDNDPAKGMNMTVLDQWETWFTEMDNNGIVIFFFFYDDARTLNHPLWNTGDNVGDAERKFIETIVDHFEHHKNLIWVVKEEYREGYTATRVSNIAGVIRAADGHDHVISVHQNHGITFDFAEDPNIDQFAIQYNVPSAFRLHSAMISAWRKASGRYNLNMAEVARGGVGNGSEARGKIWAMALGGAYVMVNGWNIKDTPLNDLQDCGRLVKFMRSTSFNKMEPHDELALGGTEFVLASPGDSYIAYASNVSEKIGLKDMITGTYHFRWLDISTGITIEQRDVNIPAGDQTWTRPAGTGREIAVYIWRKTTPPLGDTVERDASSR